MIKTYSKWGGYQNVSVCSDVPASPALGSPQAPANTLPKTNSSPLKIVHPKRKFNLPTIDFQELCQFQGGGNGKMI